MPRDLGIPLREVLAHPCLNQAKLVAGADGIIRVVKTINVMEVPDIIDWVKEGELLLTTVYAIRNDIGAQSRLIPELAAKKLAGLAIKPGRYIEKIPDIMLRQADEYRLPLIELPPDTSFSDIINSITSEILDHQAMILKRVGEVHARLSQVVLEGGSLPEIAATLSELLDNNTVIIENSLGETVAKAPANAEDVGLQKAVIRKPKGNEDVRPTMRGKVDLNSQMIAYARCNIFAGRKYYGTITVYESKYKLSDRDEITIERAATVAALEMVNRLAVTAVEMRYYNEFINEMLLADLAEEKNLRQRGKNLGLDLGRTHVAAVVHIVNLPHESTETNQQKATRGEEGDDNEEDKMLVLQHVVQGLRDVFPGMVVGYKYDRILLFIAKPGRSGGNVSDNYKNRIQAIQKYVEEKITGIYPQGRVLVGVGRPGNNLSGWQTGYREALKAYQLGQTIWPERRISFFEDLGVYRLLGSITDESELRCFVEETIGPLLAYDRQKESELLKTLEAYFECRGNLKRVSETMFLHYNTVLYRLSRIAKLTEANLEDPAICLDMQVGIKALKLLETSRVHFTK
jgi:PucR family transcriptional regulator, purine catabolism regulatory protein